MPDRLAASCTTIRSTACSPSSIPESDPLGAGYHIIQSKIALGSGGIWARASCRARRAQLNFLPEKQTDFIFTMLAEEFGFVGGAGAARCFLVLVLPTASPSPCAPAASSAGCWPLGITLNFFLYIIINVAMVMGLIPVVGVPLPLVSYGGTAMLTVLFGFGLLLAVYVHRDVPLPRFPPTSDRRSTADPVSRQAARLPAAFVGLYRCAACRALHAIARALGGRCDLGCVAGLVPPDAAPLATVAAGAAAARGWLLHPAAQAGSAAGGCAEGGAARACRYRVPGAPASTASAAR